MSLGMPKLGRVLVFLLIAGAAFFASATPAAAVCWLTAEYTTPEGRTQLLNLQTSHDGGNQNNVFPAGTTFRFRYSDEAAPLADTRDMYFELEVNGTEVMSESYNSAITLGQQFTLDNPGDTFTLRTRYNDGFLENPLLPDEEICQFQLNAIPEDEFYSDPANAQGNQTSPVRVNAAAAQYEYCRQVPAGPQREACNSCIGTAGYAEDVPSNLYTAVGCIRLDNDGLFADIVKGLLSIAGTVALLSILAAALTFTTSQGDSSKVKKAKELMTAAVSGLVFIIFSIFVMNFIGVEILRIPGLG